MLGARIPMGSGRTWLAAGRAEPGQWLVGKASAAAAREWRLLVVPAGDVAGEVRPPSYRLGDDEGVIVLVDRGAAGAALEWAAAPPSPEEIQL